MCTWCEFKQSIGAYHPEDVELRADPVFGGTIQAMVDERLVGTWRVLPVVCTCGQHI